MGFLQYNTKALAQTRKSLRNSPTPAEVKFWEIVKNKKFLGLKFRRQYSLGRYVMDFYCTEKKLCIEIDGEVHNDENQKEYDIVRTEFFQSAGIKVLRITNEEVMIGKAEEKLREIIFKINFMLKLEFPNQNHKKSYEILVQEWEKSENIPTSPGKLFAGENFEEFLEIIQEDTINNSNGVNSHLFFLIENQDILGAIHIRHHINHPNLIEKGGHIGYGIAPKYRGNGYATKILQLGLIEAKKLGIQKALLTCDIDNIGSNKVILKNGGVFERVTSDGTANRYWIELYNY